MTVSTPPQGLRSKPVLIIGGGIGGLVLAQALRRHSIPFLIFERDTEANSRLQGWALTIHFSLSYLLSLLPDDITDHLDATQVNPTLAHDRSDSIFLNLSNCAVKWRLPPGSGTRKRVSRDRFRKLLLTHLGPSLHWGKTFSSFTPTPDGGVRATFTDGSSYDGLLLIGADGASSKVRRLLYPPSSAPMKPIPVAFLGTSMHVTHAQVSPLLELDPTLFQGCHPSSNTWMWFSVMESPETNGTHTLPLAERVWKVQLCLSWPSPRGYAEIPASDAERVKMMKNRAADFDPRIRAIFHDAMKDDHSPVLSIDLADWSLPAAAAPGLAGRVTLAGDAAHTMAMYRGEGFNHAIMDDYMLLPAIQRIYDPSVPDTVEEVARVREEAIGKYEVELRARGASATWMCREACMEVHKWDELDENSVVRQKRIL